MDDPHHPDLPWPLEGADPLRDELLAAYDDAARGYHDRGHLIAVLRRLRELAAAGERYDALPVQLAAWFHDAVYDGERDAEERSACWAEDALPGLLDRGGIAEVARLVRLTETHSPAADDRNGAALSDADLGILATDTATYDAYAAAVREEYRHLTDEEFVTGRVAVLRDLAERDDLFRTAYARDRWADAARANMQRELAFWGAAAPVGAR
ncbi:hypothetical protein [Nocardioides sp. YIM 152588]|uniref:HD domain-containing protein n=1 Tax=Nocardioides sp. YIM 152588 TaxID=3158259 RepID=UPI0032E41FB1